MNLRDWPLIGGHYQYPVWSRVLELAGIAAFVGTATLTAHRIGERVVALMAEGTAAPILAIGALVVLAAYVAADLVSGIVHCLADNFGYETTPVFGVAFIKPFRDHHRDPEGITRHDFVETNGNSCIVNLFVIVPTAFLLPVATADWAFLIGLFVLGFTLSILGTNQFHKWAHLPDPPAHVRALAAMRLVLRKDVHSVHHTAPFDRYYCITTGWLNPILDRMGFFETLVRVLSRYLPLGSDEALAEAQVTSAKRAPAP